MAKLIPNHPITLKISFFTQQPPLRHDVQLLNHVDGVAGAWDPKVAAISKQETKSLATASIDVSLSIAKMLIYINNHKYMT